MSFVNRVLYYFFDLFSCLVSSPPPNIYIYFVIFFDFFFIGFFRSHDWNTSLAELAYFLLFKLYVFHANSCYLTLVFLYIIYCLFIIIIYFILMSLK